MAVKLRRSSYEYAQQLVRDGRYVADGRDDWSEHQPTTRQENEFIEREGWTEFSHWHLGIDRSQNEETKEAYSFPFGDFRRVHRSGVISAESRAGQYDHYEIRDALKALLELIDEKE